MTYILLLQSLTTAENFAARLKQANLVTKTDFDDKLKGLNQKINSNKTIFTCWKWIEKTTNIWLNLFRGKRYFKEDGTQNYLVFQPMWRYFKHVSGIGSGNNIYFWTSKGLSDENITAPTTSDHKLNPQLSYFGTKTRVEFNGSCLK